MARPQQVSDEEIDQAARIVFLRDGPSASVTRVAEQLGVSAAAVFQRVGSKQALLERSLGPGVPETAKALERGPTCHRARDARRELTNHLLTLLCFLDGALPQLVTLRVAGQRVVDDAPGALAPPLYLRACLARFLRRGRVFGFHEGAVAFRAEAILSALESRALHRFLGGDTLITRPDDDAGFVTSLLDVLVPLDAPASVDAKRPRRKPASAHQGPRTKERSDAR